MISGALQRLSLFAGISAETASLLEKAAQRRSFRRGEVIFHKGDPGTSMYVILQGQVKIILPSDGGEEAVLGVLDDEDFFGELSLIDGQPRSATIVATNPTDTIMIHRDDFLRVIRANPNVAIDMLKILARRLRETDEFVEDAIFLDVPGRLAKKLLELSEAYGTPRGEGTLIALRLTQAELATMVGATRESVNKHLRAYRARGIIDIERQRIIIRHPEELQRRIY